jgi:hypothetical protein
VKIKWLKSTFSVLKILFAMPQTNLKPEMQQHWLQEQKKYFDQAKLLSDFVGILMRLGFIWLALLFFVKQTEISTFWLEKYVMSSCIGMAFGLYFLLFFKTVRLVDAYWLADLSGTNLGKMRTMMWYVSVFLTIIISYGVTKLATAIGAASNLTR